MKFAILTAVAAMLLAPSAYANSHNPTVKDPRAATTRHAAKGHNSFTEDQARGRIAKAGYTKIGKLVKNRNGMWQGKAFKGARQINVALDYKGNVTVH
ncbi:hypothetical protein [Novosphingobium sp. BL-52-GroH]|uniref:hypothetical protein n=1 Tax=Novosphingobium sp. BL-52-GroH TaxID=3349877 RepID=UPI00384FE5D9